MMKWLVLTEGGLDMLGLLPGMLSLEDERPAAEQFNERYAHGGGWKPTPSTNREARLTHGGLRLEFPKWVEAFEAVAYTELRDEKIIVYRSSWVAIVQPDGTFEIVRMD
jgi:hypothetical protein